MLIVMKLQRFLRHEGAEGIIGIGQGGKLESHGVILLFVVVWNLF
jgi:hypothetical protein